MYAVDETIKTMARRPARHIYSRCLFGTRTGATWVNDRTYTGEDALKALTVSIGGMTGGITIGETYCAQLRVQLMGNVTVNQTDRIIPRVGFTKDDGTDTYRQGLGWFYVDSITTDGETTTITAYDKMLRAEKYYKSALEFPAAATAVLAEICDKMGVDLAADFAAPYDPQIEKKPIKGEDADGKPTYYTQREILGFLGSIFGGNWFFDAGGKLALTRFAAVTDTFAAENEIKAEFDAAEFTVTGISWDVNGQMYSREDVDAQGVVAFENPLGVTKEPVIHALEEKLVGVSYYGAEITMQGMGWFEVGDIVTAERRDGAMFPVLITGIDYTISEGLFLQKVHSSALTESESNFSADDNPRQSSGGSDTFNDAIIITQGDIPYILHSYSVVEYLRDWIIAAKGPDTQIIVNGYIVHGEDSLDVNTATIYSIVRFNAATTDTGELSTKVLKVAISRGGRTSDGYSYINFLVLDENDSKIRGPFQSYGTFGLVLTFNLVYAPDDLHPFGCAYIKAWPVYTDKNGALIRITNNVAALFASFVSTDEYQAAMRLVKTPDVGNEVIETTVKDDGNSTLEKAMMYTDTVAKSLQDSFSNITDADREQIEQNASDIAAHNVRITAAEAEIDEINAPTTGILPQAKNYTDFVADELRGEFGTT